MTNIDVNKLTSCNSDWEMNQYTILSRVKEWGSNIRKNKLYPHLAESIELDKKLKDILQENLESKWWLEKELRPRIINNKYVIHEKAQQVTSQLNLILSFVEWALKLNRPIKEEGIILREFVEENIIIKPLTNDKNFRGKGYFSLENVKKQVLNIYQYEMNWGWEDSEPVHTLNISNVRSIPISLIDKDVEDLMQEFVDYSQPLYKPMVYMFSTDLDFPYEETIYPVAEEKILKTIMS